MKLPFTLTKVRISWKMSESSHQDFSRRNNKKMMITKRFVTHALGLPIHWRMQRLEARWYIETYEMVEDGMEPLLLEFAKLDFNMVQATYQEDLKYISRWWLELDYVGILDFSRDRWMETFFWTMGCHFEPKFRNYRRQLTKLCCLLTTIDDVYDNYCSPDEIKMYTDAIERFLADFCKSYLEEAKWHDYTPTLEEYINIGWFSAGGSMIASVSFFVLTKEPSKEVLESIMDYNCSEVRRGAYKILRLTNDLATTSDEVERGDTPSAVQCYMHETGVSETAAREHIKHIIGETWKKMNGDKLSRSIFSESFIDAMLNTARASQCIYQFGDGYGVAAEPLTKSIATSMFVEPIPIACERVSSDI
ncbi:hypothetical protein MKW94_013452 [Papaver nudicaule]|uniref:Terpene synthase metal-binding domain-containing protein n=1 Tax=Papaver nudicaule TaxID=74823 RepID=A0AA41VIU2_PAPNU|nr:hypothetical protein [Papaver nudicaule]